MTTTVFGIRHHGPGCARSLGAALDALRPDLVLVEGPPDADELIPAVVLEGMRPPVAVLVWRLDEPQKASFYPFAEFSPEWQALRWAVQHGVPARFCDLPFAVRAALPEEAGVTGGTAADTDSAAVVDPLHWLAVADGYSDSERWWNDRVEESGGGAALFPAIAEAVGALRQELALPESRRDSLREAWMRRGLRAAAKEGFSNVAFVCGAWHAPAMSASSRAADDALLKGLDKVKVRATWAPWTHDRLARASGYGAGVEAPGWYEHLWQGGADLVPRWLVRAARVLRGRDLPASSASVIEAVRLAEALAGLRGRPVPGLPELDASIRSVFCSGDAAPMRLLERELLVGDRLGALPDGVARLPIDEDLRAQQKSLRLAPTAAPTPVELDLREPLGRSRSALLHRLLALQVPWGAVQQGARGRGTFKEVWVLQWRPEFALLLVDAAAHGNTVAAAAERRLAHAAANERELPGLVASLELALRCDLPAAAAAVLGAVRDAAATAADVATLLAAVPPLARIARYGDVRETDLTAVRGILGGLVARAHVGLCAAARGLAADVAAQFAEHLRAHDAALRLLADPALLDDSDGALARLADDDGAHAQLRGLATRLRRDRGTVGDDEVAARLALELGPAVPPLQAAAWLEGWLAGCGTVLVHEPRLLAVLDAWVAGLTDEHFQNVLPLVRRTFGGFSAPERRQIAQGLRAGRTGAIPQEARAPRLDLDAARARPAIDAVATLLGLPVTEGSP